MQAETKCTRSSDPRRSTPSPAAPDPADGGARAPGSTAVPQAGQAGQAEQVEPTLPPAAGGASPGAESTSTPAAGSGPSAEGSRSPSAPGASRGRARGPSAAANAFAAPFLEKLRQAVRLLEGEGAESPTEAEAALAGPFTVERVRTGGGPPAWAVVQAAEPVARGGRPAALFASRG
ncbi:MAG: hypothetical protein ACOC92_02200, partial [bacterium]